MNEFVIGIVGTRHAVDEDGAFRLMRAYVLSCEVPSEVAIRIVSGGQTGIDTLARRFAETYGYLFTEYPESAETGIFGQRCHKRNQKIAGCSDRLLAMPCPHSKGTWNTVGLFLGVNLTVNLAIREISCRS